jgi:pyridoxamine 5'-phosphate oxidase
MDEFLHQMDPDPIGQFARWYAEALDHAVTEPEAMILSTVSDQGRPAARAVLMKGFDREGFRFFTNYLSRKGHHLDNNVWVALTFLWLPLERQVRVEGTAEKLSRAESEAYFHQRPRGSQISALISPQSQVIPDRRYLEKLKESKTAEMDQKKIPLPDHWGGYLVRPLIVEFWQGRPDRLHDRYQYRRTGTFWTVERLAP